MTTRVLRSDLPRLKPILEPRVLTEVPTRVWTPEEWDRIQLGIRGRDMDDRWHAFVEGDQLFVHRSWLSDGTFVATFTETEGGYRISHVVAETSARSLVGPSDTRASTLLELVITAVILGQPADHLRRRPIETPGSGPLVEVRPSAP